MLQYGKEGGARVGVRCPGSLLDQAKLFEVVTGAPLQTFLLFVQEEFNSTLGRIPRVLMRNAHRG